MSRRPLLPGVDERALAALARQFPGSSSGADGARPEATSAAADTAAANPEGTKGKVDEAPASGSQRRPARGGRLLAALALIVALLALLVAGAAIAPPKILAWVKETVLVGGAAIAPPEIVAWVKETVGAPKIVEVFSGRRDAVDARLASDVATIKGLEERTQAASARIEAIEAVGGSSHAAAKRVDALEAVVNSLTERAAARDELVKALLARLGRTEQVMGGLEASTKAAIERTGAAEDAVKSTGERIAAVEGSLKQELGALSASVDTLRKVDLRSERFYLVAAQLRNATQRSGPFARELTAVRRFADGGAEVEAALKVLASRAERGIATGDELKTRFDGVLAPQLAALSPATRQSVAERVISWAQSLISSAAPSYVPRDNRNASVVRTAERSLAQGQLASAVDQLLLLEGNAALVAAEWLREASARLAVDKAAETVLSRAFDQFVAAR
ncbi:MAG: hypothetical protein EXQ86_11490 [Rhodospirillales bacterium]|nr:hypothetical protein [Rhodospirillales bacterium]